MPLQLVTKEQSSTALQSLTTTSPKEIEETVLSTMESILDFEEKLNRDFSIREYVLTKTPTSSQLAKAKKIMAFAMTPMPQADVEQELLNTLAVMAKQTGLTQQDYAVKLRLMAQDLDDFPADILLFATKHIRRNKTFFPSLSEIREAGEWRYHKRKLLCEMVQKSTNK
tara:strand:+ start:147 stop:653 length:507 start_codon:yes stop_codon:yes gene_type:complete